MTRCKHLSIRTVKSGRRIENATRFFCSNTVLLVASVPPSAIRLWDESAGAGLPDWRPTRVGSRSACGRNCHGATRVRATTAPCTCATACSAYTTPPWLDRRVDDVHSRAPARRHCGRSQRRRTDHPQSDDNHSHRRTAPAGVQPRPGCRREKRRLRRQLNADKAITAAQRNFFDAARDRQSPQYRPALGNYQLVASLETAYLERHLTPAVPKDVKDATNSYIAAEIALVEANTRELSDQDAQPFVVATRDSGKQLDKVCE